MPQTTTPDFIPHTEAPDFIPHDATPDFIPHGPTVVQSQIPRAYSDAANSALNLTQKMMGFGELADADFNAPKPIHSQDEITDARKILSESQGRGGDSALSMFTGDSARLAAAKKVLNESGQGPAQAYQAVHAPVTKGALSAFGYGGPGTEKQFAGSLGLMTGLGVGIGAVGTMGPAGDLITRVVSGLFAGQQGVSAASKVPGIVDAIKKQDYDRAEELAGRGGVESIFAGLSALGTRGASNDIAHMKAIYDAWAARRGALANIYPEGFGPAGTKVAPSAPSSPGAMYAQTIEMPPEPQAATPTVPPEAMVVKSDQPAAGQKAAVQPKPPVPTVGQPDYKAKAQRILTSPDATPAQKETAKNLLATYSAIDAQSQPMGPQAYSKPGVELPRALGQPIKSVLPPLPTPSEPTPLERTVTPTGISQQQVKTDLFRSVQQLKFAQQQLDRTDLNPQQRDGYNSAIDSAQQAISGLTDKWKGLIGDVPKATSRLQGSIQDLGDKYNYLQDHLNRREEVQAFEQRAIELRHTGIDVGRLEGVELKGGTEGVPLAVREGLDAALGARRVTVANANLGLKATAAAETAKPLKERSDLRATYEDLKQQFAEKARQGIIDEDLITSLKAIEPKLLLDLTRTHRSPTLQQVAAHLGVPTDSLKTTGAGKADSISHGGLPVMTQSIWENEYGAKKGTALPSVPEMEGKLTDLSRDRDVLHGIYQQLTGKEIPFSPIEKRAVKAAPKPPAPPVSMRPAPPQAPVSNEVTMLEQISKLEDQAEEMESNGTFPPGTLSMVQDRVSQKGYDDATYLKALQKLVGRSQAGFASTDLLKMGWIISEPLKAAARKINDLVNKKIRRNVEDLGELPEAARATNVLNSQKFVTSAKQEGIPAYPMSSMKDYTLPGWITPDGSAFLEATRPGEDHVSVVYKTLLGDDPFSAQGTMSPEALKLFHSWMKLGFVRKSNEVIFSAWKPDSDTISIIENQLRDGLNAQAMSRANTSIFVDFAEGPSGKQLNVEFDTDGFRENPDLMKEVSKAERMNRIGQRGAGRFDAMIGMALGGVAGTVIGGPVGTAIGLAAGGALGATDWGNIGRELSELRDSAGYTAGESITAVKRYLYGVSDNPYVSDPMFHSKAAVNRADNHARKALATYWDAADRLTHAETAALHDAAKTGDFSKLDPAWKDFIQNVFRPMDNKGFDEVNQAIMNRARATGASHDPVPFLENHDRVLWKAPKAGSQGEKFLDRASKLWGSTGFMKQHTLPDFSAGLAKGLEPVTWNFVENFQRSLSHMKRYAEFLNTQTHFIDQAKNGGVGFVFSRGGTQTPGFHYEVKGPGMEVLFPAASGEGLIKGGKWFSNDAGLATMFTNAMSSDKIAASKLGRLFFSVAHPIATMKLFGPFHAFLMANTAMATSARLGSVSVIDGLTQGDGAKIAQGLYNLAKTPFAPITMARLGRAVQHADFDSANFLKTPQGQAFAKAFPNSEALIEKLWDAGLDNAFRTPERGFWEEALNRPFPQNFTDNWRKMSEAWAQKNQLEVAGRAAWGVATTLPALAQGLMEPMFKWYIPMLKAGASLQDYAQALDHHRQDLLDGYVTEDQLARDVVARQENFLGELNTDNLYANKSLLGFFNVLYRAFSFRFGTVRGAASAITGQARELSRALPPRAQLAIGGGGAGKYGPAGQLLTGAPGDTDGPEPPRQKVPKLDLNMAQLLSFFLVNAVMAAAWYKLRGKQLPDPTKEPSKYVAPETGYKDDRGKAFQFNVPGYAGQYMEFAHDPAGYFYGGTRDFYSQIQEAITNKNFDGSWVADPASSRSNQTAYRLGHAIFPDSLVPGGFMQANIKRMAQAGQPKNLAWGLAVGAGASPAPRWLGQTPAESEAIRLGASGFPEGPVSPDKYQRYSTVRQAVAMYNNHDPNFGKFVGDAHRAGQITDNDKDTIREHIKTPYLARLLKQPNFSLEDTLSVAAKATPDEMGIVKRALRDKVENLKSSQPDPIKREALRKQAEVYIHAK